MTPTQLLRQELSKYPNLTHREWYRNIYLNSSHWKTLRQEALNFHGRHCAKCPESVRLDVHHLEYRQIFDVQVSDLQILCRSCHEKEHLPQFQGLAGQKAGGLLGIPVHVMDLIRKHLKGRKAKACHWNKAVKDAKKELQQQGLLTHQLSELMSAAKRGAGARRKQKKVLGTTVYRRSKW